MSAEGEVGHSHNVELVSGDITDRVTLSAESMISLVDQVERFGVVRGLVDQCEAHFLAATLHCQVTKGNDKVYIGQASFLDVRKTQGGDNSKLKKSLKVKLETKSRYFLSNLTKGPYFKICSDFKLGLRRPDISEPGIHRQ